MTIFMMKKKQNDFGKSSMSRQQEHKVDRV